MLAFINYRVSDVPFAAVLIDQLLTERFGREQVFLDSRSIRPGKYFPPEIWRALRSCKIVIVVIGPQWLDRAPGGQRMIDRPDDYVRREIALGLSRGILVVPVLVGEVPRLDALKLPADIAELASRQYLRLRVRDAEYDLLRLVNELMDLIDGTAQDGDRTSGGGGSSPSNVSNFYAPVDARGAVFGTHIERN